MAIGASIGYLIGGYLPEILNGEPIVENSVGLYSVAAENIFLIQAITNVFFALTAFILLKNNHNGVKQTKKSSFFQGFKDIREMGMNLNVFLISLTFVSIGAINISKYLEVYISDLGYGSEGIGKFVFVTGIVSIVTTATIIPLVIKLKRDVMIMVLVNIVSAIILFSVFRINEVMIALYTLFMFYVVMKAIYAPLETSFISSFAKDGEYGKVMGVRQSFFAIGFVIGPLIGGFLYDIKPLLVFDFSVLMFIIAAILVVLVKNNIKRELKNNKEIDVV